jgi:hypothetical protein
MFARAPPIRAKPAAATAGPVPANPVMRSVSGGAAWDFGAISIHPKLEVGPVDDRLEHEADRAADQVLRMPDPAVTQTPAAPRVSGRTAVGEGGVPADPIAAAVGAALRSPGRPLDPATRAYFEPRFGHDFSRVRIHADAPASASAHALAAQAYTIGSDIVLAAGGPAPASAAERRLLAHELAHVVQQQGAQPAGAGAFPRLGWSPPVVARQPKPPPAKAGPDPNVQLSDRLQKLLRDGKRDAVRKEVEALTPAGRDALEAATGHSRQADELVRIIRFVRHKPPAAPSEPSVTADLGIAVPKSDAKVLGGTVEMHTGGTITPAGGGNKILDVYSLTYKGADADDMRWLQFIWREVVVEPPAVGKAKPRKAPLKLRLDHSGSAYHLTTDPAKPHWTVDSSRNPPAPGQPSENRPFFEENAAVNRKAGELTMFDYPSSMDYIAARLYQSGSPPAKVVSHFHAATYLVNGMDVLYRGDTDLTWIFTADDFKKGAAPVRPVAAAHGAPANQIEAAQRTRLLIQYPDLDYLAGPTAAPPDEIETFDPVETLSPTGSMSDADWADHTKIGDMKRFADIAPVAVANLIDDVTGMSEGSINNAKDFPTGVKPGLNYTTKLGVDGQTGYVDAAGAYHNPDMPVERTGPLPRVAIVLGKKAFERDRAFAVATLRHEMEHAVHEDMAIGWLLRWRDERVPDSFADWLRAQHTARPKRISDVDFELVNTGLISGPSALIATETLAWTEGFVTVLRFLPAKPELALMRTGDLPAAIAELKGAAAAYNVAGTELRKAALKRIGEGVCALPDKAARDIVVAWIKFLLDPATVQKPTTADETRTATTIVNDFSSFKSFLNEVLKVAGKPC